MKEENVKRVSLYLPAEEYELLRKMSYEGHVKINDVARQAIQNFSGHTVVVMKSLY